LEVNFYEKEDGTEPVRDFMLSLSPKMRAKMYFSMEVLETLGGKAREPYSKFLEDGIYELRAIQGTDISRVLYFFVVGNKAILTNGFIKKSQKTPKNELELAKKYRDDYLRRTNND
jgi:phage-related protein